jgi:hypothetical protein
VAVRLRFSLLVVLVAMFAVPAANAGLISGLTSGLTQLVAPTCGVNQFPFAQFGDSHSYYAFANNGFESGSAGWTLTGGARVVSDNEPWFVNGSGGSALSLPAGATATSPATCINLFDPHFRMFAKSAAANGNVRVQILFHGLTGNLTGVLNLTSFSPSGYGDWQPSGDIPSLLALPILTTSAQVRLTSLASSGSWEIDDVFVDPWVSRIG